MQSKSKFYNIGKRNNEKMETFFDRFKAAQEKAKCQNMDQQELATHYLSALGDNTFTQIILDINDGIRDKWWKHGLEKTHKKASEHLESLKNPRIHNPNDIRNYGRGNRPGSGNTNPNGNDRRQGNRDIPDRESGDNPLGYKAQLKVWFPTTPTKAQLLAKSREMNHQCNRHTHYRNQHSILQCNSYTTAANSLGWEEVWKSAKDEEQQREGNTQQEEVTQVNRVTFDTTAPAADGSNNWQNSTNSENNNSTNTRVNAYTPETSRIYRTKLDSNTMQTPTESPSIAPLSTHAKPPSSNPNTPPTLDPLHQDPSQTPSSQPTRKSPPRKWHFFPPKQTIKSKTKHTQHSKHTFTNSINIRNKLPEQHHFMLGRRRKNSSPLDGSSHPRQWM